MAPQASQPGAQVFALDIGTRSVIGVLARFENDRLYVVDMAVREHAKRAMMDGQIEDIAQVAALAREVKEELERNQQQPLHSVCVAAAGRALKTVCVTSHTALQAGQPADAHTVYTLKRQAMEQARAQLQQESEEPGAFCCVGCAVQRYFIDGYAFAAIKGHKGNVVQADIIATFLPQEVVGSLYAAMAQAGLTVENLTLEPIAAMQAVIPQELHLLNLALVDIGAGTSDIALSEEGSISGYAMATVAGDEITEAVIQAYLVDFSTAERMKQQAAKGEVQEIAYEDILGNAYTVAVQEVREVLRPAADALADVIAKKIRETNGKTPAAVFLVGGGSKTPFLPALLAEKLGLDSRKIAIGGSNFLKRVVAAGQNLADPVYATPIGIALAAASEDAQENFFVTVNGKKVQAFYARTLCVLDVLLMAGYRYRELMGQSGSSVTYTVDGQPVTVRGQRFEPASITVNGVAASVCTVLEKADCVEVQLALPGKDAAVAAREVPEPQPACFVTLDGSLLPLGRVLLRQGRVLLPEEPVQNGDILTHGEYYNLQQLCQVHGLRLGRKTALCNGQPVSLLQPLQPQDVLTLHTASKTPKPARRPTCIKEAAPQPSAVPAEEKENSSAHVPLAAVAKENGICVLLNGKPQPLPPRKAPYQLLDILNYVEIDFANPPPGLALLHNGQAGSYLEALKDGDTVEIGATAY